MSDFTDNVRKAFELYLLGNKKDAFEHLIPGSKYHSYLTILDSLKAEKESISKDTIKKIDTFFNNMGGEEARKLKLRAMFLRYDGAKNAKVREDILNEISNELGIYVNSTKPIDLVRKTAKHEEKKRHKEPNYGKISYQGIFDKKCMISNIESTQYSNVQELHASLINDLDFNSITDPRFFNFVSVHENLAGITNKSFLQKYASAIDQMKKTNNYYQCDPYICDKLTIQQMEKLEKT